MNATCEWCHEEIPAEGGSKRHPLYAKCIYHFVLDEAGRVILDCLHDELASMKDNIVETLAIV